MEPDEIRDPTRAVLRELDEEVGVSEEGISDLALRYVATRDTGTELRTTFYFTATLDPDVPELTECEEGELRWFDIEPGPHDLSMPPTTKVALQHWLSEGRQHAIAIDRDDSRWS